MSSLDPLYNEIGRLRVEFDGVLNNHSLMHKYSEDKSSLTKKERHLLLISAHLRRKLKDLQDEFANHPELSKKINVQEIRVEYLKEACLNMELRLAAVKTHGEGRATIAGRGVQDWLDERRVTKKKLSEKLKSAGTEDDFEKILNDTENERNIADESDTYAWITLEKYAPLLKSRGSSLDIQKFIEDIQKIKTKRKEKRDDYFKNLAVQNQLTWDIKNGDTRRDTRKKLIDVNASVRRFENERRILREKQLHLMLKQGLAVLPYVDDPDEKTTILDQIHDMQKEYGRYYEYTGVNTEHYTRFPGSISLDPYSDKSIFTPMELEFRKNCAKEGYKPFEVNKDLMLSAESLKDKVEEFITWATVRPYQAQFMVEGMSLLTAAINDPKLTEHFGHLMTTLKNNANKFGALKEVNQETLEYLNLSDFFRNICNLRNSEDHDAVAFLQDLGLSELGTNADIRKVNIDDNPSAKVNSRKSFIENLAYLQKQRIPLLKDQIQMGLNESENYQELVHKEVVSKALKSSMDPEKRAKKVSSLRPSFSFNFSEFKSWTKEIFSARSLFKKVVRAGALGVSIAASGAVLGGGIAIIVTTAGIGSWVGAVLMGLSAGVFSFFYSSLNKLIDRQFEVKEITENEALKVLLHSEYFNKMKKSGAIPNYGKTPKLTKQQKKRAKTLQKTLLEDLNFQDSDVPLDMIRKLRKYVKENYPSEGVFAEENHPDICLAAVNRVIEKDLRKRINKWIDRKYESLELSGEVQSVKKYRHEIYGNLGLL